MSATLLSFMTVLPLQGYAIISKIAPPFSVSFFNFDHGCDPTAFRSKEEPSFSTEPPPFSMSARRSLRQPQRTPVQKSIAALSLVGRGCAANFSHVAVPNFFNWSESGVEEMLSVLRLSISAPPSTSFLSTAKNSSVTSDVTSTSFKAAISHGSAQWESDGLSSIKSCVLRRTLALELTTDAIIPPKSLSKSVVTNLSAILFGRDVNKLVICGSDNRSSRRR
mmetsp:Transcript_13515/g.19622  ORF Transcript_13515/g.19622 Transcript_13515/m.19622 type:complete len:222 (+) Transcript_13515:4677-5342(+)